MEEKVIIEGKFQKPPIIFCIFAVFSLFMALVPGIAALTSKSHNPVVLLFFLALGLGCLLYYIYNLLLAVKGSITVTNMRIYGTTFQSSGSFTGEKVDIPLDSISSAAIGNKLNSIIITTSSGVVRFNKIKNREDVHREISKLLLERQQQKFNSTAAVIQQSDIADQLKKFKELLDSGVITQEEFDEKKKQLLNL